MVPALHLPPGAAAQRRRRGRHPDRRAGPAGRPGRGRPSHRRDDCGRDDCRRDDCRRDDRPATAREPDAAREVQLDLRIRGAAVRPAPRLWQRPGQPDIGRLAGTGAGQRSVHPRRDHAMGPRRADRRRGTGADHAGERHQAGGLRAAVGGRHRRAVLPARQAHRAAARAHLLLQPGAPGLGRQSGLRGDRQLQHRARRADPVHLHGVRRPGGELSTRSGRPR